MAATNVDPFEAFKKKKEAASKQKVEQAKLDQAAKEMGWVEGIGPVNAQEKPDPTKPKGFMKGRYLKPPVNHAELDKIRPEIESTRLAVPKPTDPSKLAPEEKRLPKNYGKI